MNSMWTRRIVLQASAALLVAGCSAATPAPSGSGPPFVAEELATFDNPWALAFLPDGSALVTEKPGTIMHWRPDGRITAVQGVPPVAYGGQGGLLDIALSPRFPADPFVYLSYAAPIGSAGGSGLTLSRARFDGDRLTGNTVLWHDPQGGEGGQFGGIIVFAPGGQSLFLSSGERQRFTPAQDPSQPLGKILHLTLDGRPAPGNPQSEALGQAVSHVTDPPNDTEEAKSQAGRKFNWPGPNLTPAQTWSSGHRNPYGLAFAPDGRLWETEMGPSGGDELNLIERGRNYGWPLVSEGSNYNGVPIARPATRPDLAPPKLYWVPSVSPTSLVFYTGTLFPEWRQSALIGSLSGERLIRVTIDGAKAAKAEEWPMDMRIRFVGQGPDGALYLLEDGDNGRLLRLTPRQ